MQPGDTPVVPTTPAVSPFPTAAELLTPLREKAIKDLCGVYFVVDGSNNIKIGWSEDVRGCVASLQTSASTKLVLLAVAQGSRKLGGELHKRFAASRLFGEWFTVTSELAALIASLQDPAQMVAYIPASSLTPPRPATIDLWQEMLSRFVGTLNSLSLFLLSDLSMHVLGRPLRGSTEMLRFTHLLHLLGFKHKHLRMPGHVQTWWWRYEGPL